MAAYRSDNLAGAIAYWQESVALEANPPLERWIRKAEQEARADRSSEKLYGMRFLLRYENQAVPPEKAREMVAVLEEEFSRISFQLGCRTDERIVTIVQSRDAYLKATDAAEWSGGQFDGSRIRIALLENDVTGPNTRRSFAHELVHACLAGFGAIPIWLHEGLAQKLTGETVAPADRRRLAGAVRSGALPRLSRMSQTWSRMSAEHAAIAYSYALLAADLLLENYSNYGLPNILRNPSLLSQIEQDLDTRIRQQ
jgi:hypothetical protein